MDDNVRLIDANALHKEVTSFDHSVIYKDWVQSAIASAPTIFDVVPVVHAMWVWDPDGMDWRLGAWRCSRCSCKNLNLPMDSKINPRMFAGNCYCSQCGAKMDLEE